MRKVAVLVLAVLTAGPGLSQEVARPFASFDHAGPQALNDPHDLAFGPDGKLYVADKFGHRIVVVDPESLEIEAVIGAGQLPNVHDISFGADGAAAIAVTGLGVVLVFPDVAADDLQPSLVLEAPRTEGAMIHSNGQVYAVAGGIGAIIAYRDGEIVASATGHPGAHDVAEDGDGNVWVADNFNRRLVKYSPDLQLLQILDHPKFGFVGPRYMDFDAFGRLIVADQDAHRILMIDPDGPEGGSLLGVLGDGLPGEGPNKFDDPEGVAYHEGRFFFADSDNNRIVRYVVVMN